MDQIHITLMIIMDMIAKRVNGDLDKDGLMEDKFGINFALV